MTHSFTTLRHPVEKLLEAEHFLARLTYSNGLEFQFELNAFLSASRSVTFVLQKAMSDVTGFASWYGQQQAVMKADAAMRFFIELRNISQKQGPVSFVGGSLPGGGWTYRFVGRPHSLPEELIGRDIDACCAAHLVKLANLLLECVRVFPFDSCPCRAFTEEGMTALGYDWSDVEAAIGLPPGYTDVGDFPAGEKLRILSREIEPLDTASIQRIAAGQLHRASGEPQYHVSGGADLVDDMAAMIELGESPGEHPRDLFLGAILKRISDIERS
ncbi:hypothetical protein IGS74_03675 [Aureimonas sp. OT7]|jgi:hypothetical protein|uniref:hypothetical protein n=1 Tax=Aureimonas sp. OT7 TaxID=2816454 RepID=UPI0017835A35|nr:hypothetical protein [Aureimonas sp. OT7]QOG07363.1 hypothetical protein IGS74_03675 [Aureimonas sp. OT7]